MRRETESITDNAEVDLLAPDRRHPRVLPRRPAPPNPWNLNDDFILECDGQNIFTKPLANLAAAFELLKTLLHSPKLGHISMSPLHRSNA
jgi:hypothetical protein